MDEAIIRLLIIVAHDQWNANWRVLSNMETEFGKAAATVGRWYARHLNGRGPAISYVRRFYSEYDSKAFEDDLWGKVAAEITFQEAWAPQHGIVAAVWGCRPGAVGYGVKQHESNTMLAALDGRILARITGDNDSHRNFRHSDEWDDGRLDPHLGALAHEIGHFAVDHDENRPDGVMWLIDLGGSWVNYPNVELSHDSQADMAASRFFKFAY